MTAPAEHDERRVQERVTVSSVPISRESRVAVDGAVDVEAAWLDRLVVAACEMPVADGRDGGRRVPGPRARRDLPGLRRRRVPRSAAPDRRRRRRRRDVASPAPVEQQLFKYVPEGEERRGVGHGSDAPLPGLRVRARARRRATGSTLHLASRRPAARGRRLADDARRPARGARDGPWSRPRARPREGDRRRARAPRAELAHGAGREAREPRPDRRRRRARAQQPAHVDRRVHRLADPQAGARRGDPDSLERLRRIGESASRILRFTRDLVAYARPSSEVPVPVVAPQRHRAGARVLRARARASTARRSSAASPTALPPVRGMPEQLAQVFVNLFTNACHAMPADGGQLVGLERARRTTACASSSSSRTTATASRSSTSAQIFAPFFTTKVDGRGTGLGLSIVQEHHGQPQRRDPRRAHGRRRRALRAAVSRSQV